MGLGFSVQGLGFRVQGLGDRAQVRSVCGLLPHRLLSCIDSCSSTYIIEGPECLKGLGFRVWGPGLGFRFLSVEREYVEPQGGSEGVQGQQQWLSTL